MSSTTTDTYHGYIVGTRSAHLEAPDGGLVCNTRLYKKDHAHRATVLAPADLHLYRDYSLQACPQCLAYAAATCTCADCVAAR